MASVARRISEAHAGKEWPSAKWRPDPRGFAWYILGVELWAKQIEILEAIRDNPRVSVAGGRKIGKDFVLAVAALWFYSCFDDARVFCTATTGRQVDGILYRQIRQLYAKSGKCVDCKREKPNEPPPCEHSSMLTGKLGELARTGLTAPDLREIKGFTAKDEESAAGPSGEYVLAIVDEASGYPDHLHVALRGNLAAANTREVLISNPTRSTGFFHASHHENAELYYRVQVSSLDGPNVVEGRQVFPGLASRGWVEEQKREWGEDSPLYKIHVLGQFVKQSEGAIFSVHAIREAQERWLDTPAEGQLVIGVDPAGEGDKGDESGFAARRGKKALHVGARRGLTPDDHLLEVLGLIALHGQGGGELARVVVDREGETGAKVWGTFVAHVQTYEETHAGQLPFQLVGVRSSERAQRKPEVYDRVRDELSAVLADWFRDDGGIPEDPKLAKELNAFEWVGHISGRTKALAKKDIKKKIGRSPDRADALALACWASQALGATAGSPEARKTTDVYKQTPDRTFDPYVPGFGSSGRAFDPYRRP